MLNVGGVHMVKIDDVNIFGKGVCRVENMVVFVEDTLKDEVCQIRIVKALPKYAYGVVESRIEKSPERIKSLCPHYLKCGGCSFLHASIDEENSIKEAYVKKAFEKQGITASYEKIVCPVNDKYRNKVVLFFDGQDFGYMMGESNEIVPHNTCLLNEDIFDKIANETKVILKDTSIRALYMRKSSNNREIMVCPIFKAKTNVDNYVQQITHIFPQVKTILYSGTDDEKIVLEKLSFNCAYGEGYINDQICGLSFRISPESFYQVNHTCAELLYEKAIALATLSKENTCADLFCGTGTIGTIVAKKTGATVYGVEIVKRAVEDAKYNSQINGVKNAHFEAMDAGKFNKSVDVAIIDPPRKGCSQRMLQTLLRLKPQRIVYVSCNVDTMARDLKTLLECYTISAPVSVFNLFPRTSHVESVVCLSRK